MFGKIGDFIKPLLPASDKMTGETIHRVRPAGEDETPRENPEHQKNQTGAKENSGKDLTARFAEGDETIVSLDAIYTYLLGRQAQTVPPPESGFPDEKQPVPESYRAALAAYGQNAPQSPAPSSPPPPENPELAGLIEKVEALKAKGVRRIPLKIGQSFEDALTQASESTDTKSGAPHES